MAKLNKKILIAEDDKNLLSALQEKFTNEGFSVVSALDGEEGLVVAKKEKPDLFLIDIRMPKIDGITMAQKLKDAGNNAPIIFLTNLDDVKHISDAIAVSKSDYLIKSDWKLEDIVKKVKVKLGQLEVGEHSEED
ncbi:MAG: response regulator [Candidatus Falkowbacteria bacterium]|nr:response regulator [Candidatus Falkowbacteria bacterium]